MVYGKEQQNTYPAQNQAVLHQANNVPEILEAIERLKTLLETTYTSDLINRLNLDRYSNQLELTSAIAMRISGTDSESTISEDLINSELAKIKNPAFQKLCALVNAAKALNIGNIQVTCNATMNPASVNATDTGNWNFRFTGVPASVVYNICIDFIDPSNTNHMPIIKFNFMYKQEEQLLDLRNCEKTEKRHGRNKTDSAQSIAYIEQRKRELLPSVSGYNVVSKEFIMQHWTDAKKQDITIANPADSTVPLETKISVTVNTERTKRSVGMKLTPIKNTVIELAELLNHHNKFKNIISVESFFGSNDITEELFKTSAEAIEDIKGNKLDMLDTIKGMLDVSFTPPAQQQPVARLQLRL